MGCISSRHGATSSSTVVAGAKTFNFFLAQHVFSFGVCRRCGKLIIPRAKRVVSASAYKSGVRNSASHISGCENISFQSAPAKSLSVIKACSTLLSCPLRSGLLAGGLGTDAGVVPVIGCLLKVRQKMGYHSQWPTDVRQQASALWADAVGQGHAAAQSWCTARVMSQRQAQAVLELRLPVSGRWSWLYKRPMSSNTTKMMSSKPSQPLGP